MALLLPNSIFFHIPKTGGTWVRSAIDRAGIPTNEVCGRSMQIAESDRSLRHHIFHDDIGTVNPQGRFTFLFVRHPLAWYQSQWVFQLQSGKKHTLTGIIEQCMAEEFTVFARNMLREQPGFVSQLYEAYCHANDRSVDFVGRQESLVDDLVKALRLAGEQFDEAALRATPATNVAATEAIWHERIGYTPELAEALCAAERPAMEAYGYTCPVSTLERPIITAIV